MRQVIRSNRRPVWLDYVFGYHPERWYQSPAMTIQQTTVHECGNKLPREAMSSHIRELTPIFGRSSNVHSAPCPLHYLRR
jgi:hypothetical protein